MALNADQRPTSALRHGPLLLLALVLLGAAGYVYGMLSKRVAAGDSYPHYSSLRSDPTGTKALYQSLQRMSEADVERNFRKLERLSGQPGETYIFAGIDADGFNTDGSAQAAAMLNLATSGAHLLIALDPTVPRGGMWSSVEKAIDELEAEEAAKELKENKEQDESKPAKEEPKPAAPEPKKKTEKEKVIARKDSLSILLKADVRAPKSDTMDQNIGVPLKPLPGSPIAAMRLPNWRSENYFSDDPNDDFYLLRLERMAKISEVLKGKLDEYLKSKAQEKKKGLNKPEAKSQWTTHATALDKSVIMTRPVGLGSVTLCTDRYFLSNEALWQGPQPEFLLWLLGKPERIIFDETQLGGFVGDGEGIMSLARQYRMHGLFLGGMLLFALWVWRSAASLVPQNPDEDMGHWRGQSVAGQSAATGLEAMLRRGVGFTQVLSRAFSVWRGTNAAANGISPANLKKAESALAAPHSWKDFPSIYRQIRDTLHPTRK